MKLLNKVQDISKRNRRKEITVTPEEIEVALAWLADEVSQYQVRKYFKNSSATAHWWLLCRLRKAYENKQIIIK